MSKKSAKRWPRAVNPLGDLVAIADSEPAGEHHLVATLVGVGPNALPLTDADVGRRVLVCCDMLDHTPRIGGVNLLSRQSVVAVLEHA